jgi:hypothetical protein
MTRAERDTDERGDLLVAGRSQFGELGDQGRRPTSGDQGIERQSLLGRKLPGPAVERGSQRSPALALRDVDAPDIELT